MQLGISSWACAWSIGVAGQEPAQPMDAAGLIRLAAGLGVSVVQLADNLPVPDYEEVRRTAVAHGVTLELGTRGIGPAHLSRQLELCRYLGSSFLRTVADMRDDRPHPDEIVASVRAMLPELRSAGVTLGLENHDRFTAETLSGIVDRIGDPRAGVCLDTVNSFGSLEGPEVVVHTLARHVVNLHVKDFVVRRATHSMGFEITGAPAGQGRLDIPWLLAELKNAGRDPNAIIEHWPAPEGSIEQTAAKERQWCAESVAYLRTLIA